MNTDWSALVQGIETLQRSRALRFSDAFREPYARLFRLDEERPLRVLEIGCGPGALAASLHRWYPNARIDALDRDSAFIAYARAHVPGVFFAEGDAERLPYDGGTFDVTISNTVHEHIAPEAFWREQLRVLRPGGACLCLSVRRTLSACAPCLAETPEERALWASLPEDDTFRRLGVGRYRTDEAGIPAAMEAYGFRAVTTGYAVSDLTPDDPKFSRDTAEAMIEAGRLAALEAIARAGKAPLAEAAKNAVNAKYEARLRLLRAGEKQWDTETAVTMVVRGEKPTA